MADYLARARTTLQEARTLLQQGFHAGAASRAYYAIFSAARALLTTIAGVQAREVKTHRGLRRLFEIHVVLPGLMDRETARHFNYVEVTRIAADYGDRELEREEVEAAIQNADAFVAACLRILNDRSS